MGISVFATELVLVCGNSQLGVSFIINYMTTSSPASSWSCGRAPPSWRATVDLRPCSGLQPRWAQRCGTGSPSASGSGWSGPQLAADLQSRARTSLQLQSKMVVLESLGSCDQRLIQLNDIKEHHSCNVAGGRKHETEKGSNLTLTK